MLRTIRGVLLTIQLSDRHRHHAVTLEWVNEIAVVYSEQCPRSENLVRER